MGITYHAFVQHFIYSTKCIRRLFTLSNTP